MVDSNDFKILKKIKKLERTKALFLSFTVIIGIITIIIGYYQKELKYFFSAGILITILNIIYQLKIWTKIPFWLYLLIGGLSIIGFVTYKEMKKTKNKEWFQNHSFIMINYK